MQLLPLTSAVEKAAKFIHMDYCPSQPAAAFLQYFHHPAEHPFSYY